VGNSLGKAGINIANFSLGRQETPVAGQHIQAIAVVEVDGILTDAVRADLQSNPAILTVRPVEFLA
jgi:D-3-phosphoglycerate dehydrogenase